MAQYTRSKIRTIALILILTHRADSAIASKSLLTPLMMDIAEGTNIDIEASATCGEGKKYPGELYCELTDIDLEERTDEESEITYTNPYIQNCGYCDATNPSKAHPPQLMLDPSQGWWQSPSLLEGLKYERINITLSLQQVGHFFSFNVLKAIVPFSHSLV